MSMKESESLQLNVKVLRRTEQPSVHQNTPNMQYNMMIASYIANFIAALRVFWSNVIALSSLGQCNFRLCWRNYILSSFRGWLCKL